MLDKKAGFDKIVEALVFDLKSLLPVYLVIASIVCHMGHMSLSQFLS